MAPTQAPSRRSGSRASRSRVVSSLASLHRRKANRARPIILALAAALAAFALPVAPDFAQDASPHIAAVTPNTGKSDTSITITGQNLGKDKVAAVFLSDAKLDHKAIIIDQEPTKIVIKVPQLKPGDYNISVQEGAAIYIQPVIFKVKT